MYEYDFVDVLIQGHFGSKRTAAFDRAVEIIKERSVEGWELQQIIAIPNEKMGVFSIQKYVVILKKKID